MKRRSWGIPLPATAALLAILAAAVLPLASAVICESYRSFTECEGKHAVAAAPAPAPAPETEAGAAALVPPAVPCVDIPTPEGFTCAQQAGWGKCQEAWMRKAPTGAGFCTQPPQRGPCRAAVPSWYYDAGMAECRPFLYGGCQGNDNRFDSFDACAEAAARFCMS
ncbi:hypothetical protein ABPG77_004499 [Micractinium sp. CCAP 211/92]